MTPFEAPYLNWNLPYARRASRSVQPLFSWRCLKSDHKRNGAGFDKRLCGDADGSHLGRSFRTVALVTLEIRLHALLKLLVVFPNR
jgi:hypothetical protein